MPRNRLGMWSVLGAILLLSRAVSASTAPKGKRGERLNPRTGRPIVTRSGPVLSDSALRALVLSTGIADVEKAVFLAKRESGGNAGIVLDTRGMSHAELADYWHLERVQPELSVGLWQINLLANASLVPGATLEDKIRALQNPATNAEVMRRLSRNGTNWGPWGG